ncbi:MAG: sialate O-acetylesterase [Planctomycetaceae bacterium]|nr:sialate O-acetylesterase [Planctomycetaceae bacterium]
MPLGLLVLIWSFPVVAEEYDVYYLGGQSNMDGFGSNQDVPASLASELEGVFIFHGNSSPDGQPVDGRGQWAPLRAGHGYGFQADGKQNRYSDRFGAELTFAQRLRQLNPDKNIAIIKYSRGGTSIDQSSAGQFGCWEPDFSGGMGAGKGVNQYDHFLASVRYAMTDRDIDGDGEVDSLNPAGIVWMQGESDAFYSQEAADRYQRNLKRLMDLIRATLRVDDLPVVVGRISDSGAGNKKIWPYGETVRKAQRAFVEQDLAARLVVSTDEYGYSDPWHYDSNGYLDLGREFAEAVNEIRSKHE